MSWQAILAELKSQPTVSVPTAGRALADLSPNAAYRAAQHNTLGVPVMDVGGKKRVASIAVLRKLGLVEDGKAA
jgi:hypothetical protein